MISTIEEFEADAESRMFGPEEEVKLPSGLTVLARRPTPLWWITRRQLLPSRLAGIAAGIAPEVTEENREDGEQFLDTVLEAVVLQPKIRTIPAKGEISALLLSEENLRAILKCAGGEMTAEGQSLETFRGESGLPGSGADRESVALPTE